MALGLPFATPQTASAASSSSQHQRFDFALAHGALASGPATIRVHQGDAVEIRWTSDEAAELHLHGYDIEVQVGPKTPALMSFQATIPGRFPVERHGQGPGHHHQVLYLEVLP